MAYAAHFFVGDVHFDFIEGFGELFGKHFAGGVEDDVAAFAGGDAAEDEHVVEVVEVEVVGDGVAEVGADGLVDGGGAFVAGLHEFLDFDESFGESHFVGEIDFGSGEEFVDGLLGEVECADAGVAGPFVGGGLGVVVNGGEGEFVEPAEDAS